MDKRRRPRLSLDLLRGFRAAARHLSFTRAAQELFVTHPAVSREVRTLEQQLGVPLFRRVNRALQLTPAGEELFAAVDTALAQIDAASVRVAGAARALSVTTTVALASTWLVPRLPGFTREHPRIDMRLVASNDWIDLAREQVDIAIRYVPPGTPPASQDKLFDYEQFPVCAPALLRDRQRPLREPADLAQHVLLDFEAVLYGRPWYDWQQWLTAMKLRRTRGAGWMRFSHYDQVIEAAIRGSGVAVGKHPHLRRLLREGTLVAPFGPAQVARLGAFYIERAETAPRAEADAFVAWLHDEARRDAAAPGAGSATASDAPAPGCPAHVPTARRTGRQCAR